MLEFDEGPHEYRWDGKLVPSVTQILKPLSNLDGIPPGVLETARERGTAVHKACELYDYGMLDEDTLDPVLVPYLEAWKKFLHTKDLEVVLAEHLLYHPVKQYAGMIDRILQHKKTGKKYLGDIKATYAQGPTVGPQTAGYLDAWNASCPDDKIRHRLSIRLKNDGSYDPDTDLKDRSDLVIFKGCLMIQNWRTKNYG